MRDEVMLGNPKFKKNDNVSFEFDGVITQGYVMVEKEKCLYKHIPESWVQEYTKASDGNGFE